MRSILFTLLLLITITSVSAQEKIAEFTTTRYSIMGQVMKIETEFELYKDSLIVRQIDKHLVKSFKKKGLPLSTTYVHPFIKEENALGVQYTFRNDTEDFLIITEIKGSNPLVSIKNKDTFTNKVMEQLYFSL